MHGRAGNACGFGKVYEIRRTEFGREFRAALKVITEYFRSYVEDITAEYALMADLKGHTD